MEFRWKGVRGFGYVHALPTPHLPSYPKQNDRYSQSDHELEDADDQHFGSPAGSHAGGLYYLLVPVTEEKVPGTGLILWVHAHLSSVLAEGVQVHAAATKPSALSPDIHLIYISAPASA